MGNAQSLIQVGDDVNISSEDINQIKMKQATHGGWNDSMKECMEGPCKIIRISSDSIVVQGPSGRTYTLNPEIINKYSHFKKGDAVRVSNNLGLCMSLQDGHGGWNPIMASILGEIGVVEQICPMGDVNVEFNVFTFVLNPKILTKIIPEPSGPFRKGDYIRLSNCEEQCKKLQKGHGGWVDPMKQLLDKVGEVKEYLSSGDVIVRIHNLQNVFHSTLLTKVEKGMFKKGDKVMILSDKEKVKELQKNHGEWIPPMDRMLGEEGKVKMIYPGGDLRVTVMGTTLTFNPECVKKLDSNETVSSSDSDSDSDSDVPDFLKLIKGMHGLDLRDSKKNSVINMTENESKLFAAVSVGDVSQMKSLLDEGTKMDVKDGDGDTVLHLGVHTKRLNICKILIDRGADVNARNKSKNTPIMLAISSDQEDVLRLLMTASSVDLGVKNKKKDTALHLAVLESRLEAVKILLEAGADILALNKRMFTPYHLAAMTGNIKILEIFLEKSGPTIIDLQKEDKFAAIHLAVINNNQDCVRLLIKNHANLNIQNITLQTPLHIAVSQKYLDIVKILVENQADLNITDEKGNTALHIAVKKHNKEKNGKIPPRMVLMPGILQIVTQMQEGSDNPEEIAMYLAEKGTRLDITNNKGETAIAACKNEELKKKLKEMEKNEQTFISQSKVVSLDEVQKENDLLKMKIKEIEEDTLCKVCRNRKIECTFECRHVSCENCATELSKCHICQEPIKRFTKILI